MGRLQRDDRLAARRARARLEALHDEHGPRVETSVPALFDYAERWIRRDIAGLPDGTYSGEDCQEDDGFDKRSYWLRVDLTIRGRQHGRRLEPHRPQARGTINAPYRVTASATLQRRSST